MASVLSCYTNCYGAWGVWAAVEQVRAAGIAALELALRAHNMGGLVIPESAVITETTDEATVALFRAHLTHHEVTLTGCNVGGADILTPEGLEVTMKRAQAAARWFGVTLVVSGAGHPADPAQHSLAIDNLRRLGDCAGAVGITVALETHKGLTQNADAMLTLMDQVNHPHVLLNFDTGNIAYYNPGSDPVDELTRVAHLVRNVHVKDNRGQPEDWYFPAVGDGGAVDFSRVRTTMEAVGYTGAYTIEIEGIANEPEPGLEGRQLRVIRSVQHLRQCGY